MTVPDGAPHVLRLTPFFDWPEAAGVPAAPGYPAVGGIQRQALRQSRALARLEVPQTVLTLPMDGAPPRMDLDRLIDVRGVRGRAFVRSQARVGPIRQHAMWAAGVRAELRRRPPQADVVHVHAAGAAWPLLTALAVTRRLRLPLVITLHCSILATYESRSRRDAAVQLGARRVERRAVARAARTLTLTERVRAVLGAAAAGAADRITVVPDMVDVERFRALASGSAADAFAERHELRRDRPVVAFVGRISHEKGWPALIPLAERLGAIGGQLLVCGDGEDAGRLREEVERRGLEGVVTLTGELPADAIPAALACATVLVLPSTFEELGSVLVEAKAVGTPAVAFAVGGVPEAIHHDVNGLLVPPGDVGALVEAVERIVRDPALARGLGAGAADGAARYDLEAGARRLLGVYRSVAGGGRDALR